MAILADALAKPGIVGSDTVTAARRIAAHQLRCIHNMAVHSIGRYLCGKPQEEEFGDICGKPPHLCGTAVDLFDIYGFIILLLKKNFGDTVQPEMLLSLKTWAVAPPSDKKDEKKKDKNKRRRRLRPPVTQTTILCRASAKSMLTQARGQAR